MQEKKTQQTLTYTGRSFKPEHIHSAGQKLC